MKRFVFALLNCLLWVRRLGPILALALFAAIPARADVADFYRDKAVNINVGYGPGGGYDLYAPLLPRYLGAHIPGNASTVVPNMPGAAAPKNGAALATFDMNIQPICKAPIPRPLQSARREGRDDHPQNPDTATTTALPRITRDKT